MAIVKQMLLGSGEDMLETNAGLFIEQESNRAMPRDVTVHGSLLGGLVENEVFESTITVDNLFLQGHSPSTLNMFFDGDRPLTEDTSVEIDNIQLYLECSDDSENIVSDSGSSRISGSLYSSPNEATSQIKSDLQLKISFPIAGDDNVKLSKCAVCKKMFFGKDFLRDHILLEHEGLFHICQCCSYFTRSGKFFRTHMNTRHKGVPYSDVLPASISRLNMQDDNVGTHVYEEDLNKNTTVDAVTEAKSGCGIEVSQANKETIAECNKSTTDENSDSVKTRSRQEHYKCDMCNYVSHSRRLLCYHANTMHNKDRKLFKCSVCMHTCKQKRTFDAHMKKHNGIFDFKCMTCSKQFVSKHLLTKHARIHRSRPMCCNANIGITKCKGDNQDDVNMTVASSDAQTQTEIVTMSALHRKKAKHKTSNIV